MQKALVAEIEEVIEGRIAAKKDVLATEEGVSRLEVLLERRFNSLTMWLVGTALVSLGLIFTVIKLFIVK